MKKHSPCIGVIGGNEASEEVIALAYEIGKHVALSGLMLVTGGRGGVMEAASKGASENNGIVLGIIPTDSKSDANPYVDIVIPTGMGIGRNVLVVKTADVCIAFPGSYGTLSEIGLALNLGKTVVALPGVWSLKKAGIVDSNLFKEAFTAQQAIGIALSALQEV